MNNEAFRNLVNERSRDKTSKEIAREAVEEEFRDKKRKRGGGRRSKNKATDGDNYSSNESDDDGDNINRDRQQRDSGEINDEPKWKQQWRLKKQQKLANTGESSLKYRDRARERRDGKNLDYDATSSSGPVDSGLQAEMTKFLGGDMAHTHLVKGLDKTLAEKVRREEMATSSNHEQTLKEENKNTRDNNINLDDAMEHALAQSKAKVRDILKRDVNDIWLYVEHLNPTTDLGRSMLSHLIKKSHLERNGRIPSLSCDSNYQSLSTSAQMLLRTNLAFSCDGNVRNRSKAWELPKEFIVSYNEYMQSRGESDLYSYTSCTSLDTNLIEKIKTVLVPPLDTSNLKNDSKKNKKKHNKEDNKEGDMSAIEHSFNNDNQGGRKSNLVIADPSHIKKCIDEESDDDIFDDVGVYIPPGST